MKVKCHWKPRRTPRALLSASQMSYVQPLRSYWPMIATFTLAAALGSLGLTYVVSEKYSASAIVVLQPNEDISTQAKSRNALGFPLPLVPLESIANTLEDIVRGEAVLEKTVRMLHLDEKKPRKPVGPLLTMILDAKDWIKEVRDDAWEILKYGRLLPKDNFRGAMINLQKNIFIRRTVKAYTVRLEVIDDDATRAAQIVNTAGAVLAETVTAARAQMNRDARKNIEQRLTKAAQELEVLRARVGQYKDKSGVSALSQEVSLRLRSRTDLEDNLAKITADMDGAAVRKARIEEQLKTSAPSINYTATTSDNPMYNELRSEQAKLEVELSGLLQKYTPEHDDVRAVQAKLQETQERLSKETPKLVSSESTRVNDVHTKLLSDQLEVDSELRSLRARRDALQRSFDEQSRLTRGLVASEADLESLNLQLQTEEKSYQQINEAYQEALLAESKTVPEVSMQSDALVPGEPTRPIKILHIGTSLLLAIALGIGFAYLAAFMETRIHSPVHAELAVELPVVGIMPELGPMVRAELVAHDAS